MSQEPRNSQQVKTKQVSAGGDTEGASSHEAGSEAYGSSEEENQDLYANNWLKLLLYYICLFHQFF